MTRIEDKRPLPVALTHFPHYVECAQKLCKDTHTSVDDYITGSRMKLLLVGIESPSELASRVDPVTDLVIRKQRWNKELKSQLFYLKRSSDVTKTLERYNRFCTHGKLGVPMSEKSIRFVDHVGNDPDINFDGCCNWYYCGGQLNRFKIDGKDIISSVQGKKYDKLYFIPLKKKTAWAADLDSAAVVSPEKGKKIFQVVSSDQGFTIARCRNTITLYKVGLKDDEIVSKKGFTAVSEEPYVNADLTTTYCNRICSVQTNNNLCIRDVDTQTKVTEQVLFHCSPNPPEKWCAATFGVSPHMLYYSDRSCVRGFDLRKGLNKHVVCWCLRNSKLVEQRCESIYNMVPSGQDAHSVYVGTSHHVLTFDIRKKKDVVCTESWTHLLQSPPLYGCCHAGERELLVMASQVSSEVEVFSNGSLIPVMLHSFKDCLRDSNACGYNLEPEVRQRFQLSVSGLTCIDNSSKFPTVLVQTASGDIFQYELWSSSDTSLQKSCDVGKHLQGKYAFKNLECSNVLDLGYLQSVLKGNNTKKQICSKETVKLTDRKFKWFKSKEKLFTYRDMLAPSILDTWDIDTVEEWKNSKKRKSIYDIGIDVESALYKRAKVFLQELGN